MDTLQVFFAAKTHKVDVPFRCIVSERHTWQHEVSGYLLKQLSTLHVMDPFRVSNSCVVVEFLANNNPGHCEAFSLDAEDLFYSLPHDQLMKSVKSCITEDNEELAFVNSSLVSVEAFLELLSFYLKSTFVTWEGKQFIQKSGVCIGSRVAPVLSDIFLSTVDRLVDCEARDLVVKIFRYVDDYLILFRKGCPPFHYINLMKLFKEKVFGLNFTCKLPSNNCLQFLDLRLFLQSDHVCWCYSPRSKKSLLSYTSSHSKIIKNAIAMNSLHSALKKSCIHKCQDSFRQQVDRLNNAGFPAHVLVSASERLIKKCKSP